MDARDARELTRYFLESLKSEFSFLSDWEPDELNTAKRPVTFQVARVLDPNITWSLTYGRWNNEPDRSYTVGVTGIGISDGNTLKWKNLDEGDTKPEDILEDDTRFVLVKEEYCSELVEKDPGDVKYILYKRAELTVAEIQVKASRDAAEMHDQFNKRTMIQVVVTKRSEDYHACLKGEPGFWGCGKTPHAAIGDVINSHPRVFGIEIEWDISR